jgi:hypothetical protein
MFAFFALGRQEVILLLGVGGLMITTPVIAFFLVLALLRRWEGDQESRPRVEAVPSPEDEAGGRSAT